MYFIPDRTQSYLGVRGQSNIAPFRGRRYYINLRTTLGLNGKFPLSEYIHEAYKPRSRTLAERDLAERDLAERVLLRTLFTCGKLEG